MTEPKEEIYIPPDMILEFLTGEEESNKVMESDEFILTTTQQALYEALQCINKYELELERLRRFIERVEILIPIENITKQFTLKKITGKRITALRKRAELSVF